MSERRYYAGLFAGIAEASDIQHETGCTFEAAMVLQRERESERLREEPNVIFFRDPKVIAEKVAAQEGISVDEAGDLLAHFDITAIKTFYKGNSFPKREIH